VKLGSDRFAPFYTKVIAANASEAAHVLDGLLHHESSLVIREHYRILVLMFPGRFEGWLDQDLPDLPLVKGSESYIAPERLRGARMDS